MSGDLQTVIWKEWRSLIHGQNRRQLLIMVLMLAFWATWLPVQTGADWMTDGVLSVLICVLLPSLTVAVTIPPAFAGERERKTLATLLATRLSDEVILYGKLVVPVLAGCLAMVAVLLVGLIVANAASWAGSPRFYDPIVVVPNLLIGSLVAVAVAAAGVGISLRAKRVQDAQQMISLMLMVPAMALGLLLFVLAETTGGVGGVAAQLDGMNGWIIALAVIGALVVLDAALLITARRRFRRSRLITLA